MPVTEFDPSKGAPGPAETWACITRPAVPGHARPTRRIVKAGDLQITRAKDFGIVGHGVPRRPVKHQGGGAKLMALALPP